MDSDKYYLYSQNNEYNHAPESSKPKITKALASLKEKAAISNDKPSQIIQNIATSVETNVQCIPTKEAMRQQIKRIRRKNIEPEPTTLTSLVTPIAMNNTFNGELFLIKESVVRDDKILIFTTKTNLQNLKIAKY